MMQPKSACAPIGVCYRNWLVAILDTGGETLARNITAIKTTEINGLNPQAYLTEFSAASTITRPAGSKNGFVELDISTRGLQGGLNLADTRNPFRLMRIPCDTLRPYQRGLRWDSENEDTRRAMCAYVSQKRSGMSPSFFKPQIVFTAGNQLS
jgi:hypothetical protein